MNIVANADQDAEPLYAGPCAVCGRETIGYRDGMGNLLCNEHKGEFEE